MASKKRFNSLTDCRRYLASVINRLDSGEIDPQLAGRLGYLVNILASTIKDGQLEQRVEELEARMQKSKEA